MIEAARFVQVLEKSGVDFFTGVPDSLLKDFCAFIENRDGHIIAANEGAAVALAIGHYLKTGKPALVYMQNSGFGNAVNPLLSLADPEVYGVPMVLLVGWRGKAGVKDEPQHVKQGRVMTQMIDAMDLPWSVLPKEDFEEDLEEVVEMSVSCKTPYVLLVEKDTFAKFSAAGAKTSSLPSREEALIATLQAVGDGQVQVSTTGMLSRELFEYRRNSNTDASRDFLTVGGMGHCSSIALGIALKEKEREVWCLDGDGALIMHMGNLPVIAENAPKTFFHVIFNNGAHDSVGGQPTAIGVCNLPQMAKSAGYRAAWSVSALGEIAGKVSEMRGIGGPCLLELKIRPGSRSDLGRPAQTPQQSKDALMKALAS